jgi:hypothetical protein
MSPSPEEITGAAPRPHPPTPPAKAAARPPAPWKVEHTLTLEDCAAYFRYHLDHPPRPQDDLPRRAWLYMSFFGLLTFLFAVAYFAAVIELSLAECVPGLVFLLLFLLSTFYFFFGKRLRRWSLLRSIRHNRQFFDPRTLEISEEAITTTLPSGTFGYRWHTIERIIEQPDHAFFYISRGEAIILPKRVFAHERDFEEFVDTARRHRAEARRFVRTEGPA